MTATEPMMSRKGSAQKGNPIARKVIEDWINNSLRETGKTMPDLAERLGMRRSEASRIGRRRRLIAEELATVSEFLERPLPQIGFKPPGPLNVLCDVNRGDWFFRSITQRHDGFSFERFAVHVCGHLVARDFDDNSFAVCVPLQPGQRHHDRYVLVEVENKDKMFSPYVLKCIMKGDDWALRAARFDEKARTLVRSVGGTVIGARQLHGQVRNITFLGLVVGRYQSFEPLIA